MSLDWWQLPGARAFVEQLIDDLRSGKSAILCLPAHAPTDLRRAARDIWHAAEERFHTIDLRDYSDLSARPLDLLYRCFLPDAPGGDLREIGKLLETPSLADQIVWIDGLNCANRAAWGDFIKKYQDAARSADSWSRPAVFVFPFTGESAAAPPDEDIGLVVRKWRGVISSLDALLYAASLCRARGDTDVRKKLAVALIANLALWDLSLTERLAAADFEDLLEPRDTLLKIAAEREWNGDTAYDWHAGTVDEIDGRQCVHSALVIDKAELTRRLWQAQVGVLLPFVEEYRQHLLREYEYFLPDWVKLYGAKNAAGEIISDIHELEIGNLAFLFSNAAIRPSGKYKIEDLRQIRNDLAHLRPAQPQILMNL